MKLDWKECDFCGHRGPSKAFKTESFRRLWDGETVTRDSCGAEQCDEKRALWAKEEMQKINEYKRAP